MTTFPINFAKAVIWDLKGINLIQLAHRRQVCHHCCAQKKLSYFKVPKCYHCFFAQKGSPPPSYSLTYAAILIYCFNAFFSSPFVFVRGIKDPHYKTGTIQRYFAPSPTYLSTYLSTYLPAWSRICGSLPASFWFISAILQHQEIS